MQTAIKLNALKLDLLYYRCTKCFASHSQFTKKKIKEIQTMALIAFANSYKMHYRNNERTAIVSKIVLKILIMKRIIHIKMKRKKVVILFADEILNDLV